VLSASLFYEKLFYGGSHLIAPFKNFSIILEQLPKNFFCRYKSTMRLNITKIRPQDYGEYHCVSKNEMGIARAVFHLQGNDFSFPLTPKAFLTFTLNDKARIIDFLLLLLFLSIDPQREVLSSSKVCQNLLRIQSSLVLDHPRRNHTKIFVDRLKLVRNVLSRGEF
jgi:hypothetical protein